MFDNLKVGDEVAVITFGRGCIYAGRVAKITKTQIILACGSKYRKTDGRPVGSGFDEYVQSVKRRSN